jgi:hypothetical protein
VGVQCIVVYMQCIVVGMQWIVVCGQCIVMCVAVCSIWGRRNGLYASVVCVMYESVYSVSGV